MRAHRTHGHPQALIRAQNLHRPSRHRLRAAGTALVSLAMRALRRHRLVVRQQRVVVDLRSLPMKVHSGLQHRLAAARPSPHMRVHRFGPPRRLAAARMSLLGGSQDPRKKGLTRRIVVPSGHRRLSTGRQPRRYPTPLLSRHPQ